MRNIRMSLSYLIGNKGIFQSAKWDFVSNWLGRRDFNQKKRRCRFRHRLFDGELQDLIRA